ncbi:hypothetical protein ABIC63_005966 [Pseudacidovorax sp. 1753]
MHKTLVALVLTLTVCLTHGKDWAWNLTPGVVRT